MTPMEKAFNAGVEAMRQMAMVAAVTMEVRADAGDLRCRAAVAALQGLADGGKDLMLGIEPEPIHRAFALIAKEPGGNGILPCPACSGRLHWLRSESNGHVHGRCETEGCLNWMQ